MKTVRCSYDGDVYEEMPLTEWAKTCAVFFAGTGIFPPYEISRLYAQEGIANHGMTLYFLWEPFELSRSDYEYIKSDYFGEPEKDLQDISPDREIDSMDALHAWRYEKRFGVPFDEHMTYLNALQEMEKAESEARESGNVDKATELHWIYYDFGNNYAAFLDPYINPFFEEQNNEP